MLSAVEFGPFPHLQPTSATDAGMRQLHQYLTEVQLVHSGSGNPVSALDFWKNKIDSCDKLAPVAVDIVAAPASQAYVERLFSVCGLLTEGRKNQMSKSLDMRVCLKLNKNFLKFFMCHRHSLAWQGCCLICFL